MSSCTATATATEVGGRGEPRTRIPTPPTVRAMAVTLTVGWLLWNNLHSIAPSLRCAMVPLTTSTTTATAASRLTGHTNISSSSHDYDPQFNAATVGSAAAAAVATTSPVVFVWDKRSRNSRGNNHSSSSGSTDTPRRGKRGPKTAPHPLDKCYYVEDLCHASHRWFYRTKSSSDDKNGKTHRRIRKRQPNLLFQSDSASSPPHRETLYRKFYRVERPANVSTTHCTTSPIPNHLVLYSPYNDMLGEFYDRSLVFLYQLSLEAPWVVSDQTQLYVHLFEPYRGLMDSHRLFTSPFRHHPLLDFATTLWDEPSCTCLPRLVWCGYSHYRTNASTVETAMVQASFSSSRRNGDAPAVLPKPPRPSATTNLDDDYYYNNNDEGDGVDDTGVNDDSWVWVQPGGGGMGFGDRQTLGNTTWYRRVHHYMRESLVDGQPSVVLDAANFRTRMFEMHHVPLERRNNTRLVGLSQREGRRRWRDLSSLMEGTQRTLRQNGHDIVLVEANVEIDSSAYQQVVRHAALDGLIGIHGAQLTEAVWMKPGSWVIELLPYGPPGIKGGRWTRQTHSPTPLGRIFDNTDLNHVGLPLQRQHSPYCLDRPISDLDCWRNVRWGARDFIVDANTLERILQHTVLAEPAPERQMCQEFREKIDPNFLVLYNVNCADQPGHPAVPHHYYWNFSSDVVATTAAS